LRDSQEEVHGLGASIAAIGLGDQRHGAAFRDETGIEFPLLVDDERRAYKAIGLGEASLLHLFRRDNAGYRRRAKSGGHSQTGLGKNPFQLGGSFVFGPGDVDLFAHISQTFGDNADVDDLLSVLR
jgi:hypothetical protein